MPPNLQEVKLKFARRRSAKVMGSLADRETEPQEGEDLRGILVTHNFHSKIVAPEDLSTYTPLRVGSIASKLHVPFAGSVITLKLFLNEMFAGVTETSLEEGADGVTGTKFGLYNDQVRLRNESSRTEYGLTDDSSNALLILFTMDRSRSRLGKQEERRSSSGKQVPRET